MKLHAKYQRPWLSGFRQEDFLRFSLFKSKTCEPPWWGLFLPQGYNLNNLGRVPIEEVVSQISKALDFWFQKRFSLY